LSRKLENAIRYGVQRAECEAPTSRLALLSGRTGNAAIDAEPPKTHERTVFTALVNDMAH
jgi:hypothetical protein